MRAKKMSTERSVPPSNFGVRTMRQQPRRINVQHIVLAVLALVFILLGAEAVKDFGKFGENMEQKQYCDLVALHKQNPDLGWPDYAGTFNAECNADGTVKGAK